MSTTYKLYSIKFSEMSAVFFEIKFKEKNFPHSSIKSHSRMITYVGKLRGTIINSYRKQKKNREFQE